MSRADRREDREERRRAIHAYLTDDSTPEQERGWVMLALIAHAFGYVLLTTTEAVWVAVTAVRVWRRRDAGLSEAARTGVHTPALAGLLAAHVVYETLRRAGLAELSRRATGRPARR
jgi:hypothetical protein